jgi:hypothetical protein
VKIRFQSLPFKCNLQRYTEVGCGRNLPFGKGMYQEFRFPPEVGLGTLNPAS